MSTPKTTKITDEQYRLAYRQLRRPGWPSFEACMADHVRRTCLGAIARTLGRASWHNAQPLTAPAVQPAPHAAPVPSTPSAPPQRTQALRVPGNRHGLQFGMGHRRGIDLKRAAGNDRDDS